MEYLQRKMVGNVYRICNVPSNHVLGFRAKPGEDSDRQWIDSVIHIKSNQNILVIDKLGCKEIGKEYYRALTEEGIYWIHGYDLIDIDSSTSNNSDGC